MRLPIDFCGAACKSLAQCTAVFEAAFATLVVLRAVLVIDVFPVRDMVV